MLRRQYFCRPEKFAIALFSYQAPDYADDDSVRRNTQFISNFCWMLLCWIETHSAHAITNPHHSALSPNPQTLRRLRILRALGKEEIRQFAAQPFQPHKKS